MDEHAVEGEMVKPTVAVIGGGITGLMCARRLSRENVRVILFEALPTVGGQVRKATIAGRDIDMGAEAIHLSAPGMSALVDEVGLTGGLIKSNPGMSWLWTERGLKKLPEGVGPSGPRKLRPVIRAGIMSPGGLLRAGLEPLVPRQKLRGDIGVGEYVAQRFGREVVDRFVDPVLGSLHSGDVYKLSLRAITPELAGIADGRKSIMMSRRKQKAGAPMSFATWQSGLTTLTQSILAKSDVEVRTSSPSESVGVTPNGGYEVISPSGESTVVDAVVIATPARITANLVRPLSHVASALLEQVRYASVATVVVAYSNEAIKGVKAFQGTGLLVPSARGRFLKAATFVSTKWAHLSDSEYVFVRLSCGRINENVIETLSDAQLVAKLHADLVDATGIKSEPIDSYVQRWPNAMPQLEIGHQELVTKIREDLSFFKGVHLAGSSYDGLGIAACIRSGTKAAEACLADLSLVN